MQRETGVKLGIIGATAGMTIGGWQAVSGAIIGVQQGTNTAAEAGIFIGILACVLGSAVAFLAMNYRRWTMASERP